MAQATFHFPRGFLWGTATAAYQVEGNNTNSNWWVWEQEPGRIRNGDKSGLACDWWGGRWREDFDRAADAGQTAHRFSVEWSRIQPAPDRWDEDALDRYLEMLRGLRERGMTPMVTLHHFSDPIWLAKAGGWESEAVAGLFEKFVQKVVETLKEYVSLWVTLNEPNVLAAMAYVNDAFPPGRRDLGTGLRVMVNQVRAHAAAYHTIHKLQPQARVGMAVMYRSFKPANPGSPLDRLATRFLSSQFNDFFPRAASEGVARLPFGSRSVPEAKGTQDYLGINYYTRELVSFSLNANEGYTRRSLPPGAEQSTTNFIANVPDGMFEGLRWGLQFKLPIIITENGIEDTEDRLRPRYLIEHLHQVWRAVNLNYPVRGYFHWTLVDNFEWERGWAQRFGLWELDLETQARRKRPSADLYAEICRENGISSDIVARYAPEIFEKMFPN
jgi:beta-glucosidase